MHFFNPAHVMKLVEVVRAGATAPATVETLCALARTMDKVPVVVTDSPGFIVNRVARPFYLEALRLLGEKGATVGTIDRVVTGSGGFRMGP
jgi:3-hydroxybutyryl-CoA dehydrogenase